MRRLVLCRTPGGGGMEMTNDGITIRQPHFIIISRRANIIDTGVFRPLIPSRKENQTDEWVTTKGAKGAKVMGIISVSSSRPSRPS